MKYPAFLAEVVERGLHDDFARICRERHTTLAAAFASRRTPTAVAARGECWGLMRTLGFSYPEIGTLWGRDHSTVFACVNGPLWSEARAREAQLRGPGAPGILSGPEPSALEARVLALEKDLALVREELSALVRDDGVRYAPAHGQGTEAGVGRGTEAGKHPGPGIANAGEGARVPT